MSEVVNKIEDLKSLGMKFGTIKTRELLDAVGAPDMRLKILHIAGTNGKGSIAEYLTRILIAAGKKVGTFMSPAVLDYLDEVRIDGEPISQRKFDECLAAVMAHRDGQTEFETLTACALYAFADAGCEYAVVECGLGGLNDATNAVKRKEMAIISSIGLEHTAILGNTIPEICAQKAGIIADCPVVVNAFQPPEAREYFAALNSFADRGLKVEGDGKFEYAGEEYFTAMPGTAQIYNAATAVEAALKLGVEVKAIRSGIAAARLVGRVQILKKGSDTYIVDGAHNPSSFGPLSEIMRGYGDVTVIFGCLSDKDIDGDLRAISGAKRIIAVRPDSVRAMDIDKITEACKRYFGDVSVENSVSRALERSRGTVVVCGSFTLVKEALKWIENE